MDPGQIEQLGFPFLEPIFACPGEALAEFNPGLLNGSSIPPLPYIRRDFDYFGRG